MTMRISSFLDTEALVATETQLQVIDNKMMLVTVKNNNWTMADSILMFMASSLITGQSLLCQVRIALDYISRVRYYYMTRIVVSSVAGFLSLIRPQLLAD